MLGGDHDGLLNEERLRDLYRRGEIDLAEFERSLDIVLKRRATPLKARPAPPPDRAAFARREASGEEPEPSPARSAPVAAERCPSCGPPYVEQRWAHGRVTWCPRCASEEEATHRAQGGGPAAGGLMVGGIYIEEGPDADLDGDVDGGFFDALG